MVEYEQGGRKVYGKRERESDHSQQIFCDGSTDDLVFAQFVRRATSDLLAGDRRADAPDKWRVPQ